METQVTSSRSLVSHNTQKASVEKFRSYLLHDIKAEGPEYAMLKDIVRKSPSLSSSSRRTKDADLPNM